MYKYIKHTLSIAAMGLWLIIGSPGVWAAPVACGSVSMEATSANATGNIACQAEGPGNITLKAGGYNVQGGVNSGTLPTYTTILAEHTGEGTDGDFTLSGGNFTIGANVWNNWDSVYVAIKNGNSNAGGGWGMFEIDAIVGGGNYLTKILSNNPVTSISHYFAVGGTPGGQPPAVPLPAAVWLFGSALVGLVGFSRRKSATAFKA